jgi:ribosomal protein S18 acetylase RimI-like enzyme
MKALVKLKKIILAQTAVRQITLYRKDLWEIESASAQATLTPELKERLKIEHYISIPKTLLTTLDVSTKLNFQDSQGLFVWQNDELIGCILFNLEGKGELTEPFRHKFCLEPGYVYAHTLFIKQGFRSSGLGKLLYSELFKLVKEKFKYVYILVDLNNFTANKAAKSLGFKKTREVVLIKFCFLKLAFRLNNRFSQALFNLALKAAKIIIKFLIAPLALLALLLKKLLETRQNSFLTLYEVWSHRDNEKTKVAFMAMGLYETMLLTRLFPEGFMVRELKKFTRKNLKTEFTRCARDFDAVIVDAGFDYLSRNLGQQDDIYFIPHWVVQKNDSFLGLNDFSGNKNCAAHEDIRMVKKSKYEYLFTKSQPLLEFFYENMYSPYIKKRHKNEASILPLEKIKKHFRNGGLLLIKDNHKFISGSVIELKNNILHPYCMGLLNGDEELLKKDALTTLYYFYFLLAQEKGIHTVDLGMSRPFLNDGVLRYKKKWNTNIEFNKKRCNIYAFKISSFTALIKSFLLNNPFIEIEGNGLKGNIFTDSPIAPNEEELNKKYMLRGLSGLKVSVLNGKDMVKTASQPVPEVITTGVS